MENQKEPIEPFGLFPILSVKVSPASQAPALPSFFFIFVKHYFT